MPKFSQDLFFMCVLRTWQTIIPLRMRCSKKHIFTRAESAGRQGKQTKSIILPPFCATSVLELVKSYLFVQNISSDYIRKENESITFVLYPASQEREADILS